MNKHEERLHQFHNDIYIIEHIILKVTFSLKSLPIEGLHIINEREEGRLTDEASILACLHT